VTITLSPTAQRAQRARVKLAELGNGGTGKLYTAVQLANLSDEDALMDAEAFGLDLDYQPTVCVSRRIHPAHGTCKGLDAQGVLDLMDRMMDDLL
jgi:hypothetical protein